jgi:formylglycine-generating enzyme required for sulfatase activity
MPRLCSSLLLSLLIASSASAVTMDWTPIGDSGNACDPQSGGCYGAVGYAYNIGTYEVTNAQYAEFLNAKAASDSLELYNTAMGYDGFFGGGINRSGSSGAYAYATVPGRENWPVIYVSLYDSLRFANWLTNGQGSGDTETGVYTLLGGTATPANGLTVTRNAGATIVLTNEDEWYKAAYYDAPTSSYFDYPNRSNTEIGCGGGPSGANCNNFFGHVTDVGRYTLSASPYGTFDQGGNAWEWTETILSSSSQSDRVLRGGDWGNSPFILSAHFSRQQMRPGDDSPGGFRLAMIPEPSTGLLVIAGLLGLAGWRRVRA